MPHYDSTADVKKLLAYARGRVAFKSGGKVTKKTTMGEFSKGKRLRPGIRLKGGKSFIEEYRRRLNKKADGGRIGLKQGGAFGPLRGTTAGGTAKAFRGKAGFKESQALQKKITGKTKRPPEDKEKISSKRAISILKQHGHKAKVKGDKIKAAYQQGGGGVFKTKVDTLPKNPTLGRVKDWLGYKEGGIISLKKGGKADKKWIQKATKGMRKDKPCTGKKFGSATCPPGSKRYNLAKTFKKMARSKHASGGLVRYI